MNQKTLKYILIGSVSAVIVAAAIAIFINRKNLSEKTSVTGNDNVGTANVLITESKDIESLKESSEPGNDTETDNNDETGVSETTPNSYFIEGDFLADGNVSEEEKIAMEMNTKYLQDLVDNAKADQIIKLPAGTFYFTSGGINRRGSENYVILLNSNVNIVGAGINEEVQGEYTILKPYADKGTIQFGLDMFYWNELADSHGENPEYIENISFSSFIIDGEDVRGNSYNSSGKGFMINLCKDCSWNNMVVRNTDATGFGMDNVINGSITNSTAINCGKNATTTSPGASGFGIGTGYSDEESMYIANCKSIGNTKFGFFFEHQNRFGTKYYKATKSEGFVVIDSYASGNLYNFGGERANDIAYINCSSDKDTVTSDGTKAGYTELDIYFSDQSRRTSIIGFNTNNYFTDITDPSNYYYTAANWALKNGYTNGISTTEFGVGVEATRAEAVVLLWRMAERPGEVLTAKDIISTSYSNTNIQTGFNDVAGDSWHVSAIKWATDNKITNGTSSTTFSPHDKVTRADFITMLWRYAGSPKVNTNISFSDVSSDTYYYEAVKWAYSKNIIKGITDTEFSPSANCTREQIITFLYRYQAIKGNSYPIRYLLFGGTVSGNKTSYVSGTDTFTLNNPTKEGYTFIGWTGSNGSTPSKTVTINKNDVGNKTYVANFEKNS